MAGPAAELALAAETYVTDGEKLLYVVLVQADGRVLVEDAMDPERTSCVDMAELASFTVVTPGVTDG